MSNSQKANPKASNMYLLAMLADVNARMLWKTAQEAKKESEEWAYSHIQQAMNDAQGLLKNAVSSWEKYNWKVDNGWKPTVTIGQTQIVILNKTYYYVNNLIYLAKGIDPITNKVIYAVSIAGTNGVSKQDWAEDFIVATRGWKTKDNPKQIALGTWNGLSDINNLKPEHQKTLSKYLKEQIGDKPENYEIVVTGHSLGGTLAPVYALSLKEEEPNWNISFCAFAGATPGNQSFADYTARTLGKNQMYSCWNLMDVVPHAWDPKHITEIKDIYTKYQDPKHAKLTNSVLQYFIDLPNIPEPHSKTKNPYVRFISESYEAINESKVSIPVAQKELNDLVDGIHDAYKWLPLFRINTNRLCKFNPFLDNWTKVKPFIEHFCKYLLEALGQHVQPYFKHFVGEAKLFDKFINAYFYIKNLPKNTEEEKHYFNWVKKGDKVLLFLTLRHIFSHAVSHLAWQQLEEK